MQSFRSSREPSIITQYNAQILHLLPPLYNRNFTPANFPSSALLSPPLSSSTVSTITSFHSTFRKQWYTLFLSWYMQYRLHAIEAFYKLSHWRQDIAFHGTCKSQPCFQALLPHTKYDEKLGGSVGRRRCKNHNSSNACMHTISSGQNSNDLIRLLSFCYQQA